MSFLYGMHASGSWVDRRASNILDGGLPWYQIYETSDGKFLAVGALEPQFYQALLDGLGLTAEEAPQEPSDELRERFAAIFATRTRDEWMEVFAGTDACVAPVLSMTEAPQHPHNVARETFVDVDGVVHPAPAPRFSRTPSAIAAPPAPAGLAHPRSPHRLGRA